MTWTCAAAVALLACGRGAMSDDIGSLAIRAVEHMGDHHRSLSHRGFCSLQTSPQYSRSTDLQHLPAAHVTVLRYSWGTSAERIARLGHELLAWIERQKRYEVLSPPRSARYDPPFTLPFFRRNEIHVDVRNTSE